MWGCYFVCDISYILLYVLHYAMMRGLQYIGMWNIAKISHRMFHHCHCHHHRHCCCHYHCCCHHCHSRHCSNVGLNDVKYQQMHHILSLPKPIFFPTLLSMIYRSKCWGVSWLNLYSKTYRFTTLSVNRFSTAVRTNIVPVSVTHMGWWPSCISHDISLVAGLLITAAWRWWKP